MLDFNKLKIIADQKYLVKYNDVIKEIEGKIETAAQNGEYVINIKINTNHLKKSFFGRFVPIKQAKAVCDYLAKLNINTKIVRLSNRYLYLWHLDDFAINVSWK